VVLTYPFVSSYHQSDLIGAYVKTAKSRGGAIWKQVRWQYTVWAGAHISMLALAIALHGIKTGLYVYGLSMALPAFFALWTIMVFNYEQHVHTDPYSEHNHSRSFISPTLNFLLFNNGYHTIHHENPASHWSDAAELHAKIADQIHPDLQQKSLWGYWLKQYFLAPFIPSLGSVQIGNPPMDPPDERSGSPEPASA
jgi:fatty acid desaturase